MISEGLKKFGFEKDPYAYTAPMELDPEHVVWNRTDWRKIKDVVDIFIKDIKEGYSTSLRIYGGWGSGKTWLMKFIETELGEEDTFTIYSKVLGVQPTFEIFYETAIDDILKKKERIIAKIEEAEGEFSLEKCQLVFQSEDLGRSIYESFKTGTVTQNATKWLKGKRLQSDEIKALKTINQNDNDYTRATNLQLIIRSLIPLFSSVVLSVDQLEEAKPALARVISDVMRDYIDGFTEKFALICSLQAEQEDIWFDMGYSESLGTRIRYTVFLTGLTGDSIIHFIKMHHKTYSIKNEETLSPFNEEGLIYLFKIILPESRYPRIIFINSHSLLQQLMKTGKTVIDPKFVKEHEHLLKYTSPQIRF